MIEELDFGFLFCRVMHFYHYSREEVLKLPMKFFWLLNQNIDRITAQGDIRKLQVATCSQDSEATAAYRKQLFLELGDVVKKAKTFDAVPNADRDEAGIRELKILAKQRIG